MRHRTLPLALCAIAASWLGLMPCLAAASAVTVTPASGHPSQVVTVAATGFGDGEAVDVYLDTVDTLLLVTTATGTFSGSLTLPASAQPGSHYITAIGRKSGDAAQIAVNVATSWVEFGFGAGHLGWNPYENTLSTSNVSSIGLLWKAQTGATYNTPAVVGGTVYLAGVNGVKALNRVSGAAIWTAAASAGGFAGSPAVVGGVVYAASESGTVYALTAAKGATNWTRTLGGSIYSDPVVVNGVLYIGCSDGNVYALSASTGAILWKFASGSPIYVSPTVAAGVVYVPNEATTVYALNAATGVQIWSYTLPSNNFTDAAVAVANEKVFITAAQGTLYALHAANGYIDWITSVDQYTLQSTPAVANNIVYLSHGDSTSVIQAFNAYSGAELWSFSGNVDSQSPVTVANGVVYSSDVRGDLIALDASYGGQLATAGSGGEIGEVAISNGMAYFNSSDGFTYAYGLQAGADTIRQQVVKAPKPASLVPDMSLPATPSESPRSLEALRASEE